MFIFVIVNENNQSILHNDMNQQSLQNVIMIKFSNNARTNKSFDRPKNK